MLNRSVVTEFVVESPIAVSESGSPRHQFKREFVFLNNLSILRIVVSNGSFQNPIYLLRLFLGYSPVLHLRECPPVAEGSIVAEARFLFRQHARNCVTENENE